ncbi:hypothetical protein DID88_004899 [Monilinia fructigena]|uniref:Sterol regulatory element-binding protein cleavage-activating protein n=1 Tax=Monilinia fructigena TaxID=38457 RepID=A0A395ISG8_9HELO|nr:hypothetical protein DID88_004899 [Monilinia fructigena]
MIWYLLYPFRGTTEPPVLDPKHPIRDRFATFGYNVAKHSVTTITVSAIIATLLIYPFPFLFTNDFTSGASNLPHHVWSSAQPLKALDETRKPDVVMRSIWVHGSYMKALQPGVLQAALEIQDNILGPTINFNPRKTVNQVQIDDTQSEMSTDIRDTFHAVNGLSNSSWFFHSPLQYWSCSKEAIAADEDVIATVNKNLYQSTTVNVTLRHSIVFSGKRFEDHRLVAADALVITLVHMLDSPVGKYWERRAAQMGAKGSDHWRMIPSDGQSLRSTPYEFLFQPTATWESLALAVAYTMGAWWFIATLWGLRALKSRLGLLVAATTQLAFTFTSTFTICAIFKTDLSMIPREYYPLIVVFCGTENMLQLVRAVIVTPSSNHPTLRPKTFHLMDGIKIWGEGLSTFCRFATLALVFDFFYLLTFFAPVLTIDVRRPQLNDTLAASRELRYSSPERESTKPWIDFIFHGGRMPSTRIVGTWVLIIAVLICQWHFDQGILQTNQHLLGTTSTASSSILEVDVHQARTPTAWLSVAGSRNYVVLMTASRDGIIVSVGLDRWIRIWDAQHGGRSYVVEDPGSNIDPFPVLALAIDSDSNWLAILSKKMVALWNIPERRWGPTMSVDVKGRTPEAFFFSNNEVELIDPVIIVRHNGLMTELHMEDHISKELQICRTPLVCVEPHLRNLVVTNGSVPPPKIITASKRGCVHVAVQEDSGWVSYDLRLPWVSDDKDVNSILPLPALSSFLAIRNHSVDLVDIFTHNVTHSFVTKNIKPGTLQCVHSTRRRPQCGSVGLGSFAFMYTCIETGNLMMQSYLPSREGDTICFRDPDKPGSKTCCLWRETVERKYSIENPGDWQALQSGYVVGVRKLQDKGKQAASNQLLGSLGGSGLRRRGVSDRRSNSEHPGSKSDGWEVWSLGSRGDETSVPLNSVHDQLLLVGKLGPVTKVGPNSIAVALGNVVKLITVGHERYDRSVNESDKTFVGMAPAANRRKRPVLTRKRTD